MRRIMNGMGKQARGGEDRAAAGRKGINPTAAPPPLPTTAPAAEPTPVLAGDESEGGTPWWPWVVGAALVIAGLALVVARRRRTSAT